MKNKIFGALAIVALCAGALFAVNSLVYWGNMFEAPNVVGTPLAPPYGADTAITIDMDERTQVNYVSAQVNASSAVVSAVTFTDGRVSTGTITVTSIDNLSQRAATNYITVGSQSEIAAAKAVNMITISSNAAVANQQLIVNGTTLWAGRDFAVGASSDATANNLRTVLNSFPGLDASTAATNPGVVYTTAAVAGADANSFTMVSTSQTAMAVATPNFTGGRNNALTNSWITVNGVQYRQGNLWKSVDTSSGTATSLATLLNTISGIDASSAGTVVYATASALGSAGNSFTLSSSTQTVLTVGNATFVGGFDTATVTLNGTILYAGSDWAIATTSTGTAKNISDAINANATLGALVTSVWSASSATITSKSVGVTYAMAADPTSNFTLTGSQTTGALAASYTISAPTITIVGHNLSLGSSVLYSTGVVAIGGLTNQTTYFVSPLDADNIRLSTSKANAVAGTFVTLTSSSTSGPHTYTLTPIGVTGTAGLIWQISNDGTNWFALNVATVSFASPYTSSSTYWDFGLLNSRYLRASIVAPTSGAVDFDITINAKN